MPSPNSPSHRVMLLLPAPMLQFADHLAKEYSPPGIHMSRQDAIRQVLGKLMVQMKFNPPAAQSTPTRRSKTAK